MSHVIIDGNKLRVDEDSETETFPEYYGIK